MAYDSENIEDMISILKKSGYKYTSYNHKNGSCSINTNILLDAIEKKNKKQDDTTMLFETGDYVTTAYGLFDYYRCTVCGYDEILNYDNFCPHCGRRVINLH